MGFCYNTLLFLLLLPAVSYQDMQWTFSQASVSAVEGQRASLQWRVEFTASGESWFSVAINRKGKTPSDQYKQMIRQVNMAGTVTETVTLTSRAADMSLNISSVSNKMNVTFILRNLNSSTDDMVYQLNLASTTGDTGSKETTLNIQVPPTITTFVCQGCQNGGVVENQTITLLCYATGNPLPNIRWMKNGEHYNGSSSVSISNNALVFQRVAINDKGKYTCIVDNGIGNPDRESLTLSVKYKPKDTLLSPTKLDVCENDTINLNCTAEAYPPINNYSLYNGNNYLGSSSSGQLSTTARTSEKNMFCCVASNEIGSSQCAFSYVYVLGTIITLCKINNKNTTVAAAKERDRVVLQCDVSGNESYYMYQWFKVKDSLPSHLGDDTRQLTFGSINRTDEGYYQVILRDKLNCSSQTRTFNINVKHKPENTNIKISCDEVFCEEDIIQVTCTTDAKPAPVYSLYRNNVLLNTSDSGVFEVKLDKKGNYTFTCVSNNTIGVGPKKSESVAVKEPPKITDCRINGTLDTSQSVVEGDVVTVTCNNSGSPPLSGRWTKNGRVWDGNDLTFNPIHRIDAGSYKFILKNGDKCNKAEQDIFISVNHKPENTSIKITPDKNVFCEKDSIQVSCTSDAKPATLVYSLYRNHVFLNTSKSGVFVTKLAEKGNYLFTCIPNNLVGIGQSKNESVTAKEPPKIMDCRINGSLSTSQPVVEGDVVTVTCGISGSPPLRGKWTKGLRLWQNNLILNPIHRTDAGSYTFIVNNGDECNKAEQEISISVYYLDNLEVIGSSNKSYSQSNPLVLFNLSVNAYPSNTSLSCNPSVPDVLTAITSYDVGLNTKQYLIFAIIKNDMESASIVCKAEHSAGFQEKTLHFYRRPIHLTDNTPIQTTEENKTPLVAVIGVLFALSIVLNIIFIVGFLWLRRKDSEEKSGKGSKKSDERGQMNDISLQETSFTATDNETPNVPEYEPIGRRGLATSNAGIPEYEAVTRRTQPPQPQSGVQTNNPMPQYESADVHGQTEPVSNPPPVTYQTIQPRTGNYGSLSPLTRLPPKGIVLSCTGSPTRTGEYQALQHQGVSPQYQSLDDLSKC